MKSQESFTSRQEPTTYGDLLRRSHVGQSVTAALGGRSDIFGAYPVVKPELPTSAETELPQNPSTYGKLLRDRASQRVVLDLRDAIYGIEGLAEHVQVITSPTLMQQHELPLQPASVTSQSE